MISSYEEYMLKSHLLSKMYLQQYCSSGLNIANNTNNKEKIQKAGKSGDGRRGRRKEGGLESPLDLTVSTRTAEGQQALKEQLYPHNFPFASLQQMLLHSASREGKTPPSQLTPPSPSPATPDSAGETGSAKDLNYVCPICGQMFGLHDR